MKITITQDFDTVEDAAAFIARLTGGAQQIKVVIPEVSLAQPAGLPESTLAAEFLPEKKSRKRRNDAGRPRAPYKKAWNAPETNADGSGGSPAGDAQAAPTAQPATGASAPVPSATAEAPEKLTIDVLRALMATLSAVKGKGMEACLAALKTFGVTRISDLPQDKYVDFAAHVREQIPA
jgi:hypothetical protein